MNASSNGVEEASTPSTLPNLGLIPSAEESKVICGAPINLNARPAAPSTLNDRADKVLQDWMEYRVDWLDVAKEQATVETTTDDYTPLLLVIQDGVPYWRVEGLCEYVNILSWFRETGCVLFPSIAALARVWLGRSPSNAFQERVFSTGGFVMSNLRTRTDNQRAEMQVLLRHNRDEIRQMERLGDANI